MFSKNRELTEKCRILENKLEEVEKFLITCKTNSMDLLSICKDVRAQDRYNVDKMNLTFNLIQRRVKETSCIQDLTAEAIKAVNTVFDEYSVDTPERWNELMKDIEDSCG